jgi:hypothetical protein
VAIKEQLVLEDKFSKSLDQFGKQLEANNKRMEAMAKTSNKSTSTVTKNNNKILSSIKNLIAKHANLNTVMKAQAIFSKGMASQLVFASDQMWLTASGGSGLISTLIGVRKALYKVSFVMGTVTKTVQTLAVVTRGISTSAAASSAAIKTVARALKWTSTIIAHFGVGLSSLLRAFPLTARGMNLIDAAAITVRRSFKAFGEALRAADPIAGARAFAMISAALPAVQAGLKAALGPLVLFMTSLTLLQKTISKVFASAQRDIKGTTEALMKLRNPLQKVLSGGFQRSSTIDTATAQLTGMGKTVAEIADIRESAITAVTGTPFGLDEAFQTAKSALMAGINTGDDLTSYLDTVQNSAAAANTSMSNMGMIFNQILAKGKLQGDESMQLESMGIPVGSMMEQWAQAQGGKIAKKYAAGFAEVRKQGEITFGEFRAAMTEYAGKTGAEMAKSMSGRLMNFTAAIRRAGEKVIQPIMEPLKAFVSLATQAVDSVANAFANSRMGTALQKMFTGVYTVAQRISTTIGPIFTKLFNKIADVMPKIQAAVQKFAEGLGSNTFPQFAESIGNLVAAFTDAIPVLIKWLELKIESKAGQLERTAYWMKLVSDNQSLLTKAMEIGHKVASFFNGTWMRVANVLAKVWPLILIVVGTIGVKLFAAVLKLSVATGKLIVGLTRASACLLRAGKAGKQLGGAFKAAGAAAKEAAGFTKQKTAADVENTSAMHRAAAATRGAVAAMREEISAITSRNAIKGVANTQTAASTAATRMEAAAQAGLALATRQTVGALYAEAAANTALSESAAASIVALYGEVAAEKIDEAQTRMLRRQKAKLLLAERALERQRKQQVASIMMITTENEAQMASLYGVSAAQATETVTATTASAATRGLGAAFRFAGKGIKYLFKAMGPIGWAITAVMAFGAAWSAASKQLKKSLKPYTDLENKIDATSTKLKDHEKAFDANIDTVQENAAASKENVAQLAKLTSTTGTLTDAQKAQAKLLAGNISATSGFTVELDKETGKMVENTQAIYNNIEAMRQQQEFKAFSDRLVEITQDKSDTQKELNKYKKKRNKLQKELDAAAAKSADPNKTKNKTGHGGNPAKAAENWVESDHAMEKQVELDKIDAKIKKLTKTYDGLDQAYSNIINKTANAQEAFTALGGDVEDMTNGVFSLAEAQDYYNWLLNEGYMDQTQYSAILYQNSNVLRDMGVITDEVAVKNQELAVAAIETAGGFDKVATAENFAAAAAGDFGWATDIAAQNGSYAGDVVAMAWLGAADQIMTTVQMAATAAATVAQFARETDSFMSSPALSGITNDPNINPNGYGLNGKGSYASEQLTQNANTWDKTLKDLEAFNKKFNTAPTIGEGTYEKYKASKAGSTKSEVGTVDKVKSVDKVNMGDEYRKYLYELATKKNINQINLTTMAPNTSLTVNNNGQDLNPEDVMDLVNEQINKTVNGGADGTYTFV